MAVTGTYGALPLPAVAPPAGQPDGDAAIYYLLSYLQTVLNAKATTAWQAVTPSQPGPAPASVPVKKAFNHNPEEVVFSEQNLPALYLWREEGEVETIAADYRLSKDTLRLLWVWQTGTQERQRPRAPFANVITKIIDAALFLERDPSWVVSGDTDPDAARLGSHIYTWAALFHLDIKGTWKRREIHADKATDKARYFAVERSIAVQELLTETGLTALADIRVGLETTDAPPYDLADLLLPHA